MMDIKLKKTVSMPIYEQIMIQIQEKIVNGDIEAGQMLPSMRVLARDLEVSIITTKRAYEELEKLGYVVMVAGKGCYVSEKKPETFQTIYRKELAENINSIMNQAKKAGISYEDFLKEVKDQGGKIYDENL